MIKKFNAVLLVLLLIAGCANEEANNNDKETKVTKEITQVVEIEEESIILNTNEENEEGTQDQLESDFENDLFIFNDLLNEVQLVRQSAGNSFSQSSKISVDDINLYLEKLTQAEKFISDMQDYSELIKYKDTFEMFNEGSANLIGSRVFLKNFIESNYSNTELLLTALKNNAEANEYFTKAGEFFAQAYNE